LVYLDERVVTLSPAMTEALAVTKRRGGVLVLSGAVWTYPGCPMPFQGGSPLPLWYAEGTTVAALIARGELRVTEASNRAPTRVEVVES
jgi:hypothetical protein